MAAKKGSNAAANAAPATNVSDDLGIIVAKDVTLEEIEFVEVEGIKFPKGYITVIVGTPGMGKSTLIAWLTSAVSNAGLGSVYSSTEDNLSVTRARVEAAGGNLEYVALIDQDNAPIFPEDTDRLARIIERRDKTVKTEVVIVDPFADHLSPPIGNDQAIRKALNPVARLASEKNIAVIMVGHTLKNVKAKADPIEAIPGKGIGNKCRRAYVFGVNPGDASERALVCIKDQFCDEKGRGYLFTMDSDIVTDDAGTVVEVGQLTCYDNDAKVFWHDTLRPPENGEGGKKSGGRTAELLSIATEWLRDVLEPTAQNPSGVMRSAELLENAERDGISKSTLGRAKKALDIQTERHGGRSDICWFTWLPDTDEYRVIWNDADPDHAADLSDEAIAQAIKDTPVGTMPNPGLGISDDDLNQLLNGGDVA